MEMGNVAYNRLLLRHETTQFFLKRGRRGANKGDHLLTFFTCRDRWI